ncbi:MAG: HNH endonuclease [Gemmatimonadaceae bacterium]|nr:HNH endonuclease [Gemmatimonadaceae bacterium]
MVKRNDVFARDAFHCVYCGEAFAPEQLTVDHVQPKMRGGDGSLGNVVTACTTCNTAKGGRRLSEFLASNATARRNFFQRARYVWARHLRSVAEELARQGVVERPEDFVEGVQGEQRSSEAH